MQANLALVPPLRVSSESQLRQSEEACNEVKQLSPLGQAALAYAERQWRVFPLIPGEKRPIISNIYRDSSCDPEQIRAWWTENPYSNIGLDCGNSGLAAIDIDPDKPGAAALPGIMLLSGGKRAWDTWTSKTPSGGRHYLFAVADTTEGEIPTSTGIYGEPGIDGRGKGGYIVLPPSKLLKGTYELVNDKRPTPVPRTLLLPTRGTRDLSGRTELQALLQDGERIQLGGRDNFLARVAGGLRRFGFDPREIEGLLLQTYHMRCVVDGTLTEEDIKRIAESAGKYEVADSLLKKATVELETEGEWDEHDGALAINSTVFLSEYKETTTWIVDGILQTNSLNQLIGSPKS